MLAQVFDRLHHAAHLVVGVRGEGHKAFHLVCEESLLVRRQLVPVLDGFGLGGEAASLMWLAGLATRAFG
jgi:hypothetical protein